MRARAVRTHTLGTRFRVPEDAAQVVPLLTAFVAQQRVQGYAALPGDATGRPKHEL